MLCYLLVGARVVDGCRVDGVQAQADSGSGRFGVMRLEYLLTAKYTRDKLQVTASACKTLACLLVG